MRTVLAESRKPTFVTVWFAVKSIAFGSNIGTVYEHQYASVEIIAFSQRKQEIVNPAVYGVQHTPADDEAFVIGQSSECSLQGLAPWRLPSSGKESIGMVECCISQFGYHELAEFVDCVHYHLLRRTPKSPGCGE